MAIQVRNARSNVSTGASAFHVGEYNPLHCGQVNITMNPAMSRELCDFIIDNEDSASPTIIALRKQLGWHFAQRKQHAIENGGSDFADDVREAYDSK